MRRDVGMQDAARSMFHDDKHLEEAKGYRDHHTEITRHDRPGMYFRTVRGDTRRPSFNKSALAMRSCPQVGFSRAIRRIRACRSTGIGGRPGFDLQRQKSRNP